MEGGKYREERETEIDRERKPLGEQEESSMEGEEERTEEVILNPH